MVQRTNTKEILQHSNAGNPVYPKQAENSLHLSSKDVEIDEKTFDEGTGMYTFELTNGGVIEMCAVCGEFQAMNDEAMRFYDPQLVEEIEQYEWNDNRCEQRHKAFDFDLGIYR